jgi:membrane dipeptidase
MLRRTFLHGILAAGTATLTRARTGLSADGPPTADTLTVDFHSHAWRRTDFAADLRQGGVNVAVMVATADRLLLNRDSGRQRALGTAAEGALHASTVEQLTLIGQAIERDDLIAIRTPADAQRARATARPGILLGCEGGDMLEGKLERIQELYDGGVRLIQLVHYRVNELGDIQTEDPVHAGLTPFGADAIRTCNRLGIIVDVAHATFEGTRQAAKMTTRPLLLSHTFLTDAPRRYSRGITREHARAVAETGGVIGVVPFPSVFVTLQDYTAGIARMVDAAGVNHVGIGGDLAGIRGAPPYRRFEQFPTLVQLLRSHGFSSEDVAKIAGGNFMRLFAAVAVPAPNTPLPDSPPSGPRG